MKDFKPEVERVDENPFKFKAAGDEANMSLEGILRDLALFFQEEMANPDDLYAGLNLYQKKHGPAAVIRFALSVGHVSGVHAELREIASCEKNHVTERIGRLVVLLYVGLIELLEGGHYVSFPDWVLSKLKRDELKGPEGAEGSELRRYFLDLKEQYETECGASRSVIAALQSGLNEDDKKTLVRAFIFSTPAPLGQETPKRRHLHCREREEEQNKTRKEAEERRKNGVPEPPPPPWRPEFEPVLEYCLAYCGPPTLEEVSRLVPQLGRKLYEMRSQIIHTASPVLLARPDPQKGEIESGGTLADGYFTSEGRIILYEVTLTVSELVGILRRCLWRRFLSGANA